MHNFKENLSRDLELLKQFEEGARMGVAAVDTTLLILNAKIEFNYTSFANSQQRILTNNYFQSTSATFDQAISTGEIDLIQDDELRSEILNYYKLTKLNFDDNRLLETNQNFVFPKIFAALAPTREISYMLTGIETELPSLDIQALALDPDFNTWVIFKRISFQRQFENYGANISQLLELLEAINAQQVNM